jgi:hypothetical protein
MQRSTSVFSVVCFFLSKCFQEITMAKQKLHGLTFSDLDPANPEIVAQELDSGISETCILDNRKGPTGKIILVSMWYQGGGPLTLDEGLLSDHELSRVDLRSLGVAVNCFQVAWRKLGSSLWDSTGVCATPGKYFKAFGVRWDEYDVPHLILISS